MNAPEGGLRRQTKLTNTEEVYECPPKRIRKAEEAHGRGSRRQEKLTDTEKVHRLGWQGRKRPG